LYETIFQNRRNKKTMRNLDRNFINWRNEKNSRNVRSISSVFLTIVTEITLNKTIEKSTTGPKVNFFGCLHSGDLLDNLEKIILNHSEFNLSFFPHANCSKLWKMEKINYGIIVNFSYARGWFSSHYESLFMCYILDGCAAEND
jgi:hypothetical protein